MSGGARAARVAPGERRALDAPRHRRMSTAIAAGLDLVWILVFVGIGRSVHTDGVSVAGVASTAWPFVTGLAAGWLGTRLVKRPVALARSVLAAAGCVAVAMALRVVAGQGTAAPFVGVALGFIGAGMVGWRLLVRLLARRARATAAIA